MFNAYGDWMNGKEWKVFKILCVRAYIFGIYYIMPNDDAWFEFETENHGKLLYIGGGKNAVTAKKSLALFRCIRINMPAIAFKYTQTHTHSTETFFHLKNIWDE